MSIQQVVDTTGLTQLELVELYGVSRQSVHIWLNRGGKPGRHTARLVDHVNRSLLWMVEKGYLPLPSMSGEARQARIKSMKSIIQGSLVSAAK